MLNVYDQYRSHIPARSKFSEVFRDPLQNLVNVRKLRLSFSDCPYHAKATGGHVRAWKRHRLPIRRKRGSD
jgi:hypothetical protein